MSDKFVWCLTVLLSCLPVGSQAFELKPTRIVYYDNERSASVYLKNDGNAAQRFVLSTLPREAAAGQTPPEFVVYPPIVDLKPGEQRVVRVLLRNATQHRPPLQAWLRILEEPVREQAPAANQLALKRHWNFPLYYVQANTKPQARHQLITADATGEAVLLLQNLAEQPLIIRSVETPAGKRLEKLDVIIRGSEVYAFKLKSYRPPFVLVTDNKDKIAIE